VAVRFVGGEKNDTIDAAIIELNKDHSVWVDYPTEYDAMVGTDKQPLPDVPAMSGGGLWACNLTSRDEVWTAARATLL
jgi:hypothetical protein